MEVREAVWAKMWQRDALDSVAIVSELVALHNQALAEDIPLLEPVSVHKLDQTIRRIPHNTGLGSDCVQAGFVKHALVQAKLNFAAFLTASSEREVLPWDGDSPHCENQCWHSFHRPSQNLRQC